MKHLTLIANKNCTDKGTSYREAHGFTEIYEDYIKKFIGKHPRILEIGIENGGSLKMWNDYFLGDCEIYAIDILPEKKMFETENTHIFIQDQGSREDWENFKAQVGCGCKDFFDIILDDGSHFPEHQMITLYELCDCVKKDGGIYILEDLHSNISKDVFFLDGRSYEDTPLFILVDGLHREFQAGRDIINGLKCLNKGGFIVVHDCLPKDEASQVVPRIQPLWNGDVWKCIPMLSEQGIEFDVVDTDFGCGIIKYKENPEELHYMEKSPYRWRDFATRRNELMHVITIGQFFEKYLM